MNGNWAHNIYILPVGYLLYSNLPANKLRDGLLLADGSEISRDKFPDLFKIIGTLYGAGDGVSTFNLPNTVPSISGHTIPLWIRADS